MINLLDVFLGLAIMAILFLGLVAIHELISIIKKMFEMDDRQDHHDDYEAAARYARGSKNER